MKEKIFSVNTAKAVFFILFVSANGVLYGLYYTGMGETGTFFRAVLEANFNFFSEDNLKSTETLIGFVEETMWFILFELLYGNRIAGHFGIASAYYFTRQADTGTWFLKEAGKLSGITLIYVLAYYAGRLGIVFWGNDYHVTAKSMAAVLALVLLVTLYIYMFTLLVNVLAVLWDATAAFLVVVSLQLLALGALAVIADRQLRVWQGGLFLKANPISNIMLSWHSSTYWKQYMNKFHLHFPVWHSFIYFAVLTGGCLLAGCAAVKYRIKKI